jgi:peptide/nickel transport system permease protein
VVAIILRYLPWTLFAAGTGLIISFTLGILLGIVAAYRRGSALDAFLSSTATIIHAIPGFLLGIMIVIFLGVQARLIPITQMRGSLSPGVQPGLTLEFVGDALFHAALPISVYVLETYGTWLLSMKGSAVAALEEDYVAAARARGLTDGRIATAYVGRNAVLPLFAQLSIAVGYIVGGSVIIETIFVYQGVGALLNDRLARRDYPVIQGIVLLITIAVVLANLLADYVYARLDPRIGRARGGS